MLFETDRLWVRPLSLDDHPALAPMLRDPAVMQYSVHGIHDDAATRRFIQTCLTCYQTHGFGPWALIHKADHQFVGFSGIGPERVNNTDETNLGYRLTKNYWHKGLATEAVKGVLNYAFNQLALTSVVAIIEPEHTASIRVAEKSGFHQFIPINFYEKSVRLYRLTRKVWELADD